MRPGRTPLRWLLWPVLALTATLLAACAAPDRLPLGSSRDEALAKLGPPSAVHRLPDGERLQYSFQPAGPWVHNLDFDASGRLRRNTQVIAAGVCAAAAALAGASAGRGHALPG